MIEEFIREMYRFVPEDSDLRCLLNQYGYKMGVLRRDAKNAQSIRNDVYTVVSAFHYDESEREWNRRCANFGGGILLMIDDIGTGLGSKVNPAVLDLLPPTALVETSPNNFQADYFFDRLLMDADQFNGIIDATIKMLTVNGWLKKGTDPGMAGINRVFRLPSGRNSKPKYGGWDVRMPVWNPERRYAPDEIIKALGLRIIPKAKPRIRPARPGTFDHFKHIVNKLNDKGKVKHIDEWTSDEGERVMRVHITCPWLYPDPVTKKGGHGSVSKKDPVDDGCVLLAPNSNEWNNNEGGFECAHGACEEKTWRDFLLWFQMEFDQELIDEEQQATDAANRAAPAELGHYK